MMILSANTIALTQADLVALRAQNISIAHLPQTKRRGLLELDFASRTERNEWVETIQDAIDEYLLALPIPGIDEPAHREGDSLSAGSPCGGILVGLLIVFSAVFLIAKLLGLL